MVAPIGQEGEQKMMLYVRDGARIEKKFITDVRFVPMLNLTTSVEVLRRDER
jgi:protein-L-isoaspartate O-methyltransferase